MICSRSSRASSSPLWSWNRSRWCSRAAWGRWELEALAEALEAPTGKGIGQTTAAEAFAPRRTRYQNETFKKAGKSFLQKDAFNQVKITIGDEEEGGDKEKQKEMPIWISQSTVGRGAGDEAAASSGAAALESMTVSDDDDDGAGTVEQNDEITSLLLRHERKSNAVGDAAGFGGRSGGGGKAKSKKNYIPGT